jgi:hypothetical protein
MDEELERQQLIEQIERKRLIAKINDNQTEYEPSWRERATALTQGATWNWGDEATSALGATGAKALTLLPGEQAGEDESWGDIFDDIHGAESERQNEYRRERPKESLGLELASGLLTRRPGVKQGLDQLMGRTAKVAAKRAVKEAEQTGVQAVRSKIFKNVGSGMMEGAVAGAGEGSLADRSGNAAIGAGIGAAIPLGLSTVRQGARTFGRRRSKQNVGSGDNVNPLNLHEDPNASWLSDFHRDYLGKALITKNVIGKQQTKYLDSVEGAVKRGERAVDRASDLSGSRGEQVKDLTGRLKEEFDVGSQRLADDIDVRKTGIDESRMAQQDALKAQSAAKQESLKALPTRIEQQQSDKFRRTAQVESLPKHAGKLKDDVAGMEPQQAAKAIDQWWTKNAFKGAKAQDYAWSGGDSVQSNLRSMMSDQPGLVLEVGDVFMQVPALAAKMQRVALRKGGSELAPTDIAKILSSPTHISGEALMDLRNVFARSANKTPNRSNRKVVNEFDKIIRKQLKDTDPTGKLLREFNDEIKRYGTKVHLGKTVEKAPDGKFSIDQWQSTGKGRKKRYGEAPLQKEGNRLSSTMKKIKEQAGDAAGKVKTRSARDVTEAGRSGSRLKKTLDRKKRVESRKLKNIRDKDSTLTKAKAKQARTKDTVKRLSRSTKEKRKGLSKLSKRKIASSPAIHQQIAATALTNLVPGMGAWLSSAGGMRTLAGQAGWQKAGQKGYAKLMEQEKLRQMADRLRSSTIRQEAGDR